MTWDDLHLVLALSRAGSFSAAGRALGITHTTASRRLKACESALGTQLFDRTPAGLKATAAGEILVSGAEDMEARFLAVQGQTQGRSTRLAGPLKVSTMDLLLEVSKEALSSFVRRYPEISLSLDTRSSLLSLHRREADVAIRLSPAPPEGLIGRRVGRPSFAVFGHPDLIAAQAPDAPLSRFPWLALIPTPDNRWFQPWLDQHAPGATITMYISQDSATIAHMTCEGVGVFLMPVWQGRALGLCQVGPVLSGHDTSVWLLTHPDLRNNARVRAFMDHTGARLSALSIW